MRGLQMTDYFYFLNTLQIQHKERITQPSNLPLNLLESRFNMIF